MFSPALIQHVGANESTIKSTITEVKKGLVREDRIVWFLRLFKMNMIAKALNKNKTPEFLAYSEKELKKYNSKAGSNFTYEDFKKIPPFKKLLSALTHYYSMKIHNVEKYVFSYEMPDEIIEQFEEWEDAHVARFSEDRLIVNRNEGVFLDVGGGWKWFDLNRSFCTEEGEAMGHCGNEQNGKGDANQTVLSLRLKTMVDGKVFWIPHATFIYHKAEKTLGEMKGVDNQKPEDETHNAIVKLLYDDRILSISGGGWEPHHNFSVNDLDDATKDALLAKKPNLRNFVEKLEAEGITKSVLKDLERAGATIDYNNEEYPYVLETFKSLSDMVEEIGNSTAKWIMGILEGSSKEYIDFAEGLDDAQVFKDNLSYEQEEIIRNYIRVNHKELYDEAEEENYGDDPDWYDLVDAIDDDWFEGWVEEFKRLPGDAQTSGTQAEMADALTDNLDSLEHEFDIGVFKHGDNVWDAKYTANLRKYELKDFIDFDYEISDAGDFIEALDEHMAEDNMELKVDAPYNGFMDFDMKSFDQQVKQQLEELEKKTNET